MSPLLSGGTLAASAADVRFAYGFAVFTFAAPGVARRRERPVGGRIVRVRPVGNARERSLVGVRVGDVDGEHRALDQIERLRVDRGRVDRALVAERVEQRVLRRVDERQAVRGAVLRIDVDDELRSRREGARQRLPAVLRAVAAVHEHERDPVERCRSRAGVGDLDEAAGVGTDLVVVDLVDHESGVTGGRRRRPARLARQGDQVGGRRADLDVAVGAVERLAGRARKRVDRADSRAGIPLRAGRPCRSGRACGTRRALDVPRDMGLVALAGVGAEDDADEAVPRVAACLDRRRSVAGRGRERGGAQEHRSRRADERDRVSIHGRSSLDVVGRPTEVPPQRRDA